MRNEFCDHDFREDIDDWAYHPNEQKQGESVMDFEGDGSEYDTDADRILASQGKM